MNIMRPPPFAIVYDLLKLSEAGAEVRIVANPEQRRELARWADLDSVETFEAQVRLRRLSASRFEYKADLAAGIVQSCVVTLEPVRSNLVLAIARSLHLMKMPRGKAAEQLELSAPSDEGPEEIHDTRYDLAGPLVEEFSLAVDPYPRAAGVTFDPPGEPDAPDNPFAVLKRREEDR
jgi:hypothetical protein